MARSERESAIHQPLTAMLGVDSNLRVLRVLSTHGGMLATSEIVRRSRLSRESVRNGLLSLESLGIIISAGSERSRVYRINDGHYLAKRLSALFKAESERFSAILESVRRSAAERPLFSLFVYGSVARGEDRPDSDLDIGVIADANDLANLVEGIREELREAAEKLIFVPNVVGLDFDDVKRLAEEDNPWWKSMTRDAIVISGKRPEDALLFDGEVHGPDGFHEEEKRGFR